MLRQNNTLFMTNMLPWLHDASSVCAPLFIYSVLRAGSASSIRLPSPGFLTLAWPPSEERKQEKQRQHQELEEEEDEEVELGLELIPIIIILQVSLPACIEV